MLYEDNAKYGVPVVGMLNIVRDRIHWSNGLNWNRILEATQENCNGIWTSKRTNIEAVLLGTSLTFTNLEEKESSKTKKKKKIKPSPSYSVYFEEGKIILIQD